MRDSARVCVSTSSIRRICSVVLCFLLFVPRIESTPREDPVFLSKNDLENREVLGMATGYGLLAVATFNRIVFYTDNNERKKMGQITLPYQDRRFLELKLFSKSEIFYCDERTCGLCTYSENTSSCSTIRLHEQNRTIKSAAVVKLSNLEGFMISVSYFDEENRLKMATLRYLAEDNGVLDPVAYTIEANFKTDHSSLIGYKLGNYVYFVVSSTQASEPEAILTNSYVNLTVTKIMRFCAGDQTKDLASQISIMVGCDLEERNMNAKAEAAIYHEETQLLEVSMINTAEKNRMICRFKMNTIEKKFNGVWDVCQKTPFGESEQKKHDCMYPPQFDIMAKKRGCMTFTKIESEQTTFCMRFGRDEPMDNCRLHESKSAAYQFGWLEDYNVLQGELMMKIPANSNINKIKSIMSHGKSYFVSVYNSKNASELLKISASNTAKFRQNWFTPISDSGKSSVAILNQEMALYPTIDGIKSVMIECADLYRSCADLQNGGWSDPLECAWCADTPTFHTVSEVEKDKCGTLFVNHCPPEIKIVSKYSNNTGFTIVGSNIEVLHNPQIESCNTKCTITKLDNSSIECDVGEENRVPSDCSKVHLNGTIGDKFYSFPYNYKSDSGVQTERVSSDEKKNSSPGWKVALAILSVLLLICIVVVIVYIMRNRLPQIKNQMHNPMSPRIVNEYDLNTIGGRSAQISFSDENYVTVFRELPIAIKIDAKQLFIDKSFNIGKGNFGVVYHAVYTSHQGHSQDVACKFMTKGSVREFYAEARIMAEFNHPHVLKLIGVTLDSNLPGIVTEFMAKGDLKSFISNDQNEIKMRELFQYAIDISKGMAYIHSKGYIHRDLAARNCMVDAHRSVRIADFGLCRKVDADTQLYVTKSDRELPVRWYPPEVMANDYDETTDVWSFGIVVWELFTRGQLPYGGKITTDNLFRWLLSSEQNRLEKPFYCPQKLYDEAMLKCWKADSRQRPSFAQLIVMIEDIVKYMEGYDLAQFNSGYERVSPRSVIYPRLDRAYYQIRGVVRNTLNQFRQEYQNVEQPQSVVAHSTTSTTTESSEINEYLYLSDCHDS